MRCRKIERLLPGLAESSLSPREAASCAEHLAGCPGCARLAGELVHLPRLLSAWEAPATQLPDGDAAANWVLRQAAARGQAPRWGRRAVAAAAALLLAAVATAWWRSAGTGSPPETQVVRHPVVERPAAGATSAPAPAVTASDQHPSAPRTVRATPAFPRVRQPHRAQGRLRRALAPRTRTAGAGGRLARQSPRPAAPRGRGPAAAQLTPVFYIVDDAEAGRVVVEALAAPPSREGLTEEGTR